MPSLQIPVPQPFAFRETVISHGWYVLAPFQWNERKETLLRTELLGGSAVDLSIRYRGKLIVESDCDLRALRPELLAKLSRMFQLHLDLSEFVALCRTAPTHRHITPVTCGRLLCGSTFFEDAVKIIATTNTTWRQTTRMVELLVETAGATSPDRRKAFPSPAQIAAAPLDALRDCKLGYRSSYVKALAAGIADGSIDLDELRGQSRQTSEMMKGFRLLPGIGPYGAAHLLAMEGRFDFIAVDTEFRRFVRDRYHGGRKVGDPTLVRRYRAWGRWKYLAYWSELWKEVAEGLAGSGQLEKTPQ